MDKDSDVLMKVIDLLDDAVALLSDWNNRKGKDRDKGINHVALELADRSEYLYRRLKELTI